MKKVSLGLTAIALMVGLASAFASKTVVTGATFWRTVVHQTTLTKAQVLATCKGINVTCALQYTTAHPNTWTGQVIFKAI